LCRPLPAFAGVCISVSFIEAGDGDVMDHIFNVLAEWKGCDDVQVFAMTKRGTCGIRNINAILHAMASATKPKVEGWGFAEGDPIIYLENDYQKELWNGSLGGIESVPSSNGKRALLCSLDGARHEIPEEEFQRLDLAYAITVHKPQGSQFKRVIVPVVRSRMLDRTLICTALTRAVEQVVFVGGPGRIRSGSHRAAPLTRATGWLRSVNPVLRSAVQRRLSPKLSCAGPSRYTGFVSAPDRR
jgi:exodeoxyribonuclease V alpha subunit